MRSNRCLSQQVTSVSKNFKYLQQDICNFQIFPFQNTFSFLQNAAHSNSRWSELDLLILLGTLGHVLSLGASSFIEEEHQTWYFLVSTLCLALCHDIYRNYLPGDDCEPQRCLHVEGGFDGATPALQDKNTSSAVLELNRGCKSPSSLGTLRGYEKWMVLASPWVILTCCRLLRSLNQTGVQWAHRPDLGHWLTR